MTITLDKTAEDKLVQEAEAHGMKAEEYAEQLLIRQLESSVKVPKAKWGSYNRPSSPPVWLESLRPVRLPDPGKTWIDHVVGKWPGNETEEELLASVQRIDDEDAGRL